MARPSVAAQRKEQIVDAAIRTIGAHGITGATLDRIAEEAGMSRGHVRHFVGNRDELLVETARSFYFGEPGATSILPPGATTVAEALDYLFGPEFTAPGTQNAVVFGLIEASRTNPAINDILIRAYVGAEETLREMLRAEHPDASAELRDHVAHGLMSTAMHNVFMNDIDDSPERNAAARAAADWMLGMLRS